MRRLLSLGLLLALAVPARAHFLWLLPDNQGQVKMVFSDELAPDKNVAVTKVAKTKLFGRDADGKAFDVKAEEDKHHYRLTFPVKAPAVVGGACEYGVLAKKGDPYLLMYYA